MNSLFEVCISDAVLQRLPEFRVFGVCCFAINQSQISLSDRISRIEQKEEIAESDLRIIKAWKDFHKNNGSPKKARASIEYIIKAFSSGKLRRINPIVDLYNYASMFARAPVGAEDIEKLGGKLVLSVASGEEKFIPLMSSSIENPASKELIWLSGNNDVVCRSINWIESDITKITEATTSVIFISEQPINDFLGSELAISIIFDELSLCGFSCISEPFKINSKTPSKIINLCA